MRVLIVIGTSVAYRLSMRGAKVTVVERSGIACAASGKAGGFLALDWCDGSPLAALARRSFVLHDELAADLDDDWGYTGASRPTPVRSTRTMRRDARGSPGRRDPWR